MFEPSGTTVLECGELDMIRIEETDVKMDRSRNQHHVNIIVTIVTVKIYHYSLIHKSLMIALSEEKFFLSLSFERNYDKAFMSIHLLISNLL